MSILVSKHNGFLFTARGAEKNEIIIYSIT